MLFDVGSSSNFYVVQGSLALYSPDIYTKFFPTYISFLMIFSMLTWPSVKEQSDSGLPVLLFWLVELSCKNHSYIKCDPTGNEWSYFNRTQYCGMATPERFIEATHYFIKELLCLYFSSLCFFPLMVYTSILFPLYSMLFAIASNLLWGNSIFIKIKWLVTCKINVTLFLQGKKKWWSNW